MTDGRNPPSSVVCRPSSMDHQLPMADVIGAGRLCSATPVFGLPPLFMSCYLPFSTFNPSRVAREREVLCPPGCTRGYSHSSPTGLGPPNAGCPNHNPAPWSVVCGPSTVDHQSINTRFHEAPNVRFGLLPSSVIGLPSTLSDLRLL